MFNVKWSGGCPDFDGFKSLYFTLGCVGHSCLQPYCDGDWHLKGLATCEQSLKYHLLELIMNKAQNRFGRCLLKQN